MLTGWNVYSAILFFKALFASSWARRRVSSGNLAWTGVDTKPLIGGLDWMLLKYLDMSMTSGDGDGLLFEVVLDVAGRNANLKRRAIIDQKNSITKV